MICAKGDLGKGEVKGENFRELTTGKTRHIEIVFHLLYPADRCIPAIVWKFGLKHNRLPF